MRPEKRGGHGQVGLDRIQPNCQRMRIPVASNIIRTAKQIVNAHTSKIDGRILSASMARSPSQPSLPLVRQYPDQASGNLVTVVAAAPTVEQDIHPCVNEY
jgi:hypothetical protein